MNQKPSMRPYLDQTTVERFVKLWPFHKLLGLRLVRVDSQAIELAMDPAPHLTCDAHLHPGAVSSFAAASMWIGAQAFWAPPGRIACVSMDLNPAAVGAELPLHCRSWVSRPPTRLFTVECELFTSDHPVGGGQSEYTRPGEL